MLLGIMTTINSDIDFDTAAFIADDIGVELELKLERTAKTLSASLKLEICGVTTKIASFAP